MENRCEAYVAISIDPKLFKEKRLLLTGEEIGNCTGLILNAI